MTLWNLIKRNCKIYFKDKSVFFPSLITPFILLLLYLTFLRNVYVESFHAALPTGAVVSENLIGGFVGGWLLSSLVAVCAITVSFCANIIMVADKATGTLKDLTVTPVKQFTLSMSYYLATVIVTCVICSVAIVGGLVYLACVGWYLSAGDVFALLADAFLLILFGTSVSCIINRFLRSVGGCSAVCSIVSAGYGFISGAYMPMAQFGTGLRNALMCMPWTYGTGLVRTHALRGVLAALETSGLPQEAVSSISSNFDITLTFFGSNVSVGVMYAVVGVTTLLLIGIFILLNALKKRNKS